MRYVLAFCLLFTFTFASAATELPADNATEIVITSDEFADISFTVTEEDACGFPVHWSTDAGSGSFDMGCDGSTTMTDILNTLLALFW